MTSVSDAARKALLAAVAFLPAMAYADEATDTINGGEMNEVVVTGTRTATDVRHLPMTVKVIDRQQIEQTNLPTIQGLITQHVPGMFTTARGILGYGVSGGSAGAVTSRGIGSSHAAQMVVLIDGHPQYMSLMGHPIADAYQSLMAERVEVVRSPASVLYGSNAMGGVVNIVTRKPVQDGVKTRLHVGSGSFNTILSEVTNQIHYGKFSSTVSGSFNRTDGHRTDMGFRQATGFAKIGYELTNHWNTTADVNLTHFHASNPGTVSNPLLDADQSITRGEASLAVGNRYERATGSLSMFYNWGNHWINDGYDVGTLPKDFRFLSRDRLLGLNAHETLNLFSGNHLTAGVDYFLIGGRAWNHYLDNHDQSLADTTQHEVAGYVEMRQDLGKWLTLDAGLRVDHHTVSGTEWIPQFGASAHLPHRAELKALASRGFRNPTLRELYMFRPANPALNAESMWNYELSYTQTVLDGALRYGVNLFYIDASNIIQTTMVNGRPLNINTGRLQNHGVEGEVSYRVSADWQLSANYSYLHMKHPVVAAPEHKTNVEATYHHKRISASTSLQYIHGLYTAVTPEKKENFLLWSMNVNYQANAIVGLWLRGENLLAQRYEINAGFPMPRATVFGGVNLTF